MNHFMLPDGGEAGLVSPSARYGTYAMEVLLNHLLKLGAKREHLEAKVFGGGNVLPGLVQANVGHKNAAFVEALDLRGLVCLGYPLHPPGKPQQLRASHLRDLRVPTLIVQGTRDTFGAPDDLRPHLDGASVPVTVQPPAAQAPAIGFRSARPMKPVGKQGAEAQAVLSSPSSTRPASAGLEFAVAVAPSVSDGTTPASGSQASAGDRKRANSTGHSWAGGGRWPRLRRHRRDRRRPK